MKNALRSFLKKLDGLKYNRRAVYWILATDIALGISSTVVDWPWLIRVPPNLVAFAPICSLYPWLLVAWFALFLWKKKVPSWFTSFLLVGLFSYGIMAWIYFPLYMSWNGLNFHDIGSMFWVAAYALQGFIIASEIKKIPVYQYLLIFAYFFFKDYSDRYLGTFLDVLLDSYPETLKTIFFVSTLTLHSFAAALLFHLAYGKKNLTAEQQLAGDMSPSPGQ